VRWFRNTAFSLRALNRARVRTMLSACSMTIGIAAMFILFSLGAGAEKVFEDALASMGKNLLAVGSVRQQTDALRGQGRRVQTLTLDDWRAISSEVAGVERAAPIAMNNFDVRYGGRATNVTVIGTTPEYRYSNVHHPSLGRFFDDVDIQSQARVAVIGPQIAKELFFGEQPIGERLLIGGAPYEVIGVLQAKGTDAGGVPQDDKILVPVTTAMRRLLNVEAYATCCDGAMRWIFRHGPMTLRSGTRLNWCGRFAVAMRRCNVSCVVCRHCSLPWPVRAFSP